MTADGLGDGTTPQHPMVDDDRSVERAKVGDVLDERYVLLAELGRGAQGVVFRARDKSADAVVALKLIGRGALSPAQLARLRRELQNARRITHPNVLRLHDLVDLGVGFGLSMELVDGETLAQRLSRSPPLSADDLSVLASDLAQSLAAAHDAGVTHRDLKPSNVLIREGTGRAVVADFGVSRFREENHDSEGRGDESGPGTLTLTSEGGLVGTPAYMAPEQLEAGREVGPAVDVYAAGLILWEAATGHRLHESALSIRGLRAARKERVPRLADLRPDLRPRFRVLVERMLSPDPALRPADGTALAVALEETMSKQPIGPRVAALLLAVAFAAGGLAWWRKPTLLRATASASSGAATAETPGPIVRELRRVTFEAGCESYPAFADDHTLLFDSDAFLGPTGQSASEIVSLDLANGSLTRLTHQDGNDYNAKVSPDGKWLAYLHGDDPVVARALPASGDDGVVPIELGAAKSCAWAQDGTLIVARADGSILRGSISEGTATFREVAHLSTGLFATGLAPLADGRIAALWRRVNEAPVLGELSTEGLATVVDDRVSTSFADVGVGPTGTLLYYGRMTAAGAIELVDRELSAGTPKPLPNGIAPRGGFAFSPDGARLAYSTCNGSSILMRLRSGEHAADLLPRSDWEDFSPKRIDARQLVLSSTRSGREQVWKVDVHTGAATFVAEEGRSPAASIDGRRVVYVIARGGLRIANGEGATPLTLTEDPTDNFPQFDRTGSTVVFQRTTPAGKRVFAVPASGGVAIPIAPVGSSWPAPSPVEDRVAYLQVGSDTPVRLVGLDGSHDVPASTTFPSGSYRSLRYSPDGRRVLVVHGEELLEADVDHRGPPTTRVHIEGSSLIASVDYAPDGDGFVAAVTRYTGDIWIAEGRFP